MLGFLHPWLLAGLAAAGIPLVLHLLARREPPTVTFPAVRYLVDTTREHSRRLQLQHWLLLLLRTLLIALLVLAAAGPVVPIPGGAGHAPAALVLVLDNSASSGTTVGGTPRLTRLKEAARAVLARANPADRLWLIGGDGTPIRGDAAALRVAVNALAPMPLRLDLGAAVTTGDRLVAESGLPGSVVVLSDLQTSAVTPARPAAPVVLGALSDPAPRNLGIQRLDAGVQPWSTDGGRVTVGLVGDSGRPVSVSVGLDGRPRREVLLGAGGAATVALPGTAPGWRILEAELEPDEFRLDDHRVEALRIAPVARVQWDTAERYTAAAAAVLAANGRLARGDEIMLGRLGPGLSVVEPPSDPAGLGALNRALERRGVQWRYGEPVPAAAATDSGPLLGRERVLRRLALEPIGRPAGILATVGGQPWVVRSQGVILLGSRLDPEWTDLPLSAGFVPFLDGLLNRAARGDLALLHGTPGRPAALPDLVDGVISGDRQWRTEGGAGFVPPAPGVYFLLAGGDTVGALSVNLDPRESRLAAADPDAVERLWGQVRSVGLTRVAGAAFAGTARSDLRGALLWAALLAGLIEAGLASFWKRSR